MDKEKNMERKGPEVSFSGKDFLETIERSMNNLILSHDEGGAVIEGNAKNKLGNAIRIFFPISSKSIETPQEQLKNDKEYCKNVAFPLLRILWDIASEKKTTDIDISMGELTNYIHFDDNDQQCSDEEARSRLWLAIQNMSRVRLRIYAREDIYVESNLVGITKVITGKNKKHPKLVSIELLKREAGIAFSFEEKYLEMNKNKQSSENNPNGVVVLDVLKL